MSRTPCTRRSVISSSNMVFLRSSAAAAVCSTCMTTAFIPNSAVIPRNGINSPSPRVSTSGVIIPRSFAPPLRAVVHVASRRRDRPRPLPQPLFSSRTVDVDVIDVTDVTEEEERRQKEKEELNERIGMRFKQRSAAEVTQEVRQLVDEALQIFREAGPGVVGARGVRASRAVLLTLGDLLQDWREGKLLKPRSDTEDASSSPTSRPPLGAGGAGAVRGSVGGVTAAAWPQEIDPAGVARALRLLFERLGATYVKLGQFIASSPTLFPAEYVMEFQKCLDATEPIPYSRILTIVKQELGGGARVSEEFQYIDPKPLASASVAQVHRAKLRTGEEVVLKVRKPGVEGTLQADLGFLYVASRLVEILQPELGRASFSAIASDVRSAMLDELDFRKEAENIESFNDFLDKAGITEAVAPKVYENLSTERLLVMERFRGVPLTDLEGIRAYSSDPEATLITALNTWSMSVMMAESFHADVHAGNLMVLEDGRVGFIDFGIVGRIPKSVWVSLRGLSNGFIAKDYRLMASSLVEMGAADGEVKIDAFAFDIERVVDRLLSMEARVDTTAVIDEQTGRVSYGTSVDVDQETITRLLLDIVGVAENNGLKLPREFGLLIKQALYFDRYTRLLAPDLDPLRDDRVTLPTGEDRGRPD
ncbi:unnamed protein product [Ascophyllum nodosum]